MGNVGDDKTMVRISDLKVISTELSFGGLFNRRLTGIKFIHNDLEFASSGIDKSRIKARTFVINMSSGEVVKVVERDKHGFEFEIWTNNAKWIYHNSGNLFSLNHYESYSSETGKLKYQRNGFGLMMYLDDQFVDRIKEVRKNLFWRLRCRIEFIDFESVNLQLALCTIEIVKRYVYRHYEPEGG